MGADVLLSDQVCREVDLRVNAMTCSSRSNFDCLAVSASASNSSRMSAATWVKLGVVMQPPRTSCTSAVRCRNHRTWPLWQSLRLFHSQFSLCSIADLILPMHEKRVSILASQLHFRCLGKAVFMMFLQAAATARRILQVVGSESRLPKQSMQNAPRRLH